jgi:hypothetical protein
VGRLERTVAEMGRWVDKRVLKILRENGNEVKELRE